MLCNGFNMTYTPQINKTTMLLHSILMLYINLIDLLTWKKIKMQFRNYIRVECFPDRSCHSICIDWVVKKAENIFLNAE